MFKSFFQKHWIYLIILVIALILPLLISEGYIFRVIIISCIFAIATLGLNIIIGYTGQVSLAQAGFFGIGGYGVAIMTQAGISFWLALPASALIAALVGLLVGLPTLRTRGAYFAIATLCFGMIVHIVAGNWKQLTGGHIGIIGIPLPSEISLPFINNIAFHSQTSQYYLVLAFLLLTIFVMYRLIYSPKGLIFMAVRNNENLAQAVGINTFATKILSFVISTFFAGLAGGIYASLSGSISPSITSYLLTFDWLIYLLLGGAATIAGPIIGAFAIPILMEYLQIISEYRLLIFGVLLIVGIIYFPRGLMGGVEKIKHYFTKRKVGVEHDIESGKSNEKI